MAAVIYSLLEYSITIYGARGKTSQANMMYIGYFVATQEVIVESGTLLGIERCTIVGSNLVLSCCADIRDLHYGHLGIGHTHNPRTTFGFRSLNLDSRSEHGRKNQRKAQKKSLHILVF